jgi:hypothetical protein
VLSAVTVNLAAGTYTENVTIQDMLFTNPNASLSIVGAGYAQVTPATGSGSGSLTAHTVQSVTSLGTMSDSGQSWTPGNLIGVFIRLTSGSASGQRRVITANTATVVSYAGTFSPNPSAGDTYVLEIPSSSITGRVFLLPSLLGTGVATAGYPIIAMSTVNITASALGGAITVSPGATVRLQLDGVRVIQPGSSGIGIGLNGNTSANLLGVSNPVYVQATTGAGTGITVSRGGLVSTGQRSQFYIRAGGTAMLASSSGAQGLFNYGVFETVSASASPLTFTGEFSATGQITGQTLYVICPGGSSTNTAVTVGSALYAPVSRVSLNTSVVLGCSVGIEVIGPGANFTATNTISFSEVATALKATAGGQVYQTGAYFQAPTLGDGGATTFLNMDGTTILKATLDAQTPKTANNAATGSSYYGNY